MTTQSDDEQEARAAAYGSMRYRWYVLFVMILVYSCHAMDRALPGILIEPIRADLKISDAQLGLISGSSYGLAFALSVLPMGMLSDRLNRRNFLGILLIGWSLCTTLGGLAKHMGHLILARAGVGVFESGAGSISMPMLSDIFPPKSRTFVLGIFYMSANIGTFLAGAVGGLVAATYGWRAAFLVIGAPGIVIALLFLLTVREPVRGGLEEPSGAVEGPAPSLPTVLGYVVKNPALACLIVGSALAGLMSITMAAWMGSFFIRVHGLNIAQAGLILGLGGGLCGVLSPPLLSWIAQQLSLRDPRWALRVVWLALLGAFLSGMTMLFVPVVGLAIAAFVLADFLRSCYPAITYSVLMTNTPANMRGTIMSFALFLVNLIGFGFGPLVVGFLSDLHGGGVAIRYALRDAHVIYLVIIVLYITGSYLLYGPKKGKGEESGPSGRY